MSIVIGAGSIQQRDDGFVVCLDKHANSPGTQLWCPHLKNFIEAGGDAMWIKADDQYMVPIFPTSDIFAEVHIGEVQWGTAAEMFIAFTPDIGRTYSVPLGFWNEGEGRASIRAVIMDYIKSKVDPRDTEHMADPKIHTKCPSKTHSFAAQQLIMKNHNAAFKWTNLWYIVMEKACIYCINDSGGDAEASLREFANTSKPWSASLMTTDFPSVPVKHVSIEYK